MPHLNFRFVSLSRFIALRMNIIQFADIDPNYLSSGYGSCQFQLINMRQDVLFGFFSGNVTNPILHATSKPVQFKDPNEILQVHLAQGRDSSEMV